MNNKIKFAIPVIAGVLAISTGTGVALAKGPSQDMTAIPTANYAPAPQNGTRGDSAVVAYCGGWGGMMSLATGQGLLTQQLADLLGTTPADLRTRLASGQTLAELAGAKGVTQDQLIQTMIAPFNDQMSLMLKYGYVSQDQIDSMTTQMKLRLQTVVTSQLTNNDGYGWGFMGTTTPQQPGTSTPPRSGFGGMMQGYTGAMMGTR
jgi:hypothetical protein